MYQRSFVHFFRHFGTRFLFLLLALCCLGGCVQMESRPRRTKSSADIPVMADTEPQPRKKRVALTFDDGPQYYADRTRLVVDELSKYGYHATFFVVGNRIASGDALTYAVEHGNEIGIHGYTHSQDHYYDVCSDSIYEQEISKTANAIHSVLPDYDIRLMRPVGGRISTERLLTSPYSIVLWSVDSDDWNNRYYPGISDEDAQAKVDTVVNNVMSAVGDGDIILMHEIYESTYDAVKIILQRLYEEGYDVVTVSELFDYNMESGTKYECALPVGA